MKKLGSYFKTVRKELKTILYIAIGGYITITIVSLFPELFTGSNKIGDFFSKICLSYTTSFIFYFVVVHIKSEKDKENVNEFIAIQLSDIITSGHLYFEPFIKGKKNNKLTLSDLTDDKFHSVNRFAQDSFYITSDGQNYTWVQCYEILKKNTFDAIDTIFKRYNHLDATLIKLLSRIEYSMLYYQWSLLYYDKYDKTFAQFSLQLKAYFIAIEELEEYASKRFKPASLIRGEFMHMDKLLKY